VNVEIVFAFLYSKFVKLQICSCVHNTAFGLSALLRHAYKFASVPWKTQPKNVNSKNIQHAISNNKKVSSIFESEKFCCENVPVLGAKVSVPR
jgi:hypothetical protein